MNSNEIRRSFLSFFEERDHVVRPSASLIPVDPTLLLTSAGMVPFKPYFLGEETPPYLRAASIQKCARTTDIDIIGTTTRHFSFFEMLGNFSFGDYFKERAIPWSYELVTEVFGIDPERLWFTVYDTDDEAARIWIDQVGVPSDRVQRGGKDNFWQMGVPGPCGPSSEIFVDRGERWGEPGGPIGGGEERFVEIWNLVFMQNVQDEPYHVIGDLPAKSIDTGMGLDRMAMVLQGADTVFDTDIVRPLLGAGAAACRATYGTDELTDVSLRVLADHGRAVTFLIADGVVPSNEGRGYVLRRLLRRAVRHAWQLGSENLVTPQLVSTTVEIMGEAYPTLVDQQDFILDIVSREEGRFRKTLESGHNLLDTELAGLGEGSELEGGVAFKLHDTYGFPIELTKEIAAERGYAVDESGFDAAMKQQRERARAAWKGGEEAAAEDLYRRILDDVGLTAFLGYELEAADGRILAILRHGEPVDRADQGDEVELFLDRTPFYAEAGGQVGDVGRVGTETGVLSVGDVQHAVQGLYAHRGKIASGFLQVGQDVETAIDSPRREKIRKSHTGTHILHWALRDVVGDHVKQAGSLVEAGRLRFDVNHFAALTEEQLTEVERLANEKIIANSAVQTVESTKDEAQAMGAIAFFGDKYGDTVRVVKVGEFSTEFCGGTHTRAAGQVGPLIVTGESSIGSNMRRVEALTGTSAYAHLVGVRDSLTTSGRLLRSTPSEVPVRVQQLIERNKELESEVARMADRVRSDLAGDAAAAAEKVGDAAFVVLDHRDMPPDAMRALAIQARDRLGSGVVIVGSVNEGKGALVAAVSSDLVARGLSAAELIAPAARLLGGGGSRDPELAQAGGPAGKSMPASLDLVRETVGKALRGL
ncbi:MAG: alanine--tRNA ligase [Acidimicrobiia bacterium]|nr:alanine--tRNA ligase [Acidimicrobiia bacterium]